MKLDEKINTIKELVTKIVSGTDLEGRFTTFSDLKQCSVTRTFLDINYNMSVDIREDFNNEELIKARLLNLLYTVKDDIDSTIEEITSK